MRTHGALCCLLGSLLLACVAVGGASAQRNPGRKALQEQWSEWWCEGSGCDDFPPAQQNGGQPGGQTGQPPQTNGQPIGQPNGQPTQDNGQGAPSAPTGQGAPCPDQQAVLDQHNQARAARAAQPLQWSALLAADAAAWSAQCNRDNFGYSHSPGSSDGSFGENLAWFENRGDQCGTGVQSWLNEQSQWSPNNPMNFAAGHYTQMVWKESTQVGCGIALCRQGQWGPEYLVTCRYTPPGNFGAQEDWARNV
ncbi:hypothetical protein CHLNCDRAFT_135097 [Chlorella variabilis]|uniref:SCP domain-containing protein n=1 Tax=Chlorella variabilis TaxID=554065 RepID=E1ZHI0_CHLVA|nr:hypothetical protein CHLNCDRAFT_135097 [Chlorella variabilis]EFN54466.1 hypothetical protein CHLNCDRAFT_135097 [Chlorella variabilis]|eukprot:XP_005846568.1 hypothetical protein CHLNCDRAFT_135097 [Chlorella variabilis]